MEVDHDTAVDCAKKKLISIVHAKKTMRLPKDATSITVSSLHSIWNLSQKTYINIGE